MVVFPYFHIKDNRRIIIGRFVARLWSGLNPTKLHSFKTQKERGEVVDRYEFEHKYLLKWIQERDEKIKVIMLEGYTKREAIELLKLMALQGRK